MAVDSGDQLWQLNSDRRFEEILGPPEVLDELQHYLFFEPLPFVSRVVFLATPHRGSDLSRRRGRPRRREPDRRARPDRQPAHPARSRTTPTPSTAASSAGCRRASRRSSPTRRSCWPCWRCSPAPSVAFHSIIGSLRPGRRRRDDRRRRPLPQRPPRRGRVRGDGPVRSRRAEGPRGDPRGPPDLARAPRARPQSDRPGPARRAPAGNRPCRAGLPLSLDPVGIACLSCLPPSHDSFGHRDTPSLGWGLIQGWKPARVDLGTGQKPASGENGLGMRPRSPLP